ncbi:MAG: ATP-binding cassette domain-containing protein [Ghiorsea sp.]|nr:ATP-binding cassette domain-containing protein [Ghiorsea sp.]
MTQVCEQLEISHLLKRTPAMLSTGEAQRVSLARAIYGKPSMLLLDEPFSAQAPDIRARLRQVLKTMQQTLAIPLLMISHDTEDAKALAQQHWRMREGKLMVSINRHSREGGNPYFENIGEKT